MSTEPCYLCGEKQDTKWRSLRLCAKCFDYIGRMWFTDPGPAYRERVQEYDSPAEELKSLEELTGSYRRQYRRLESELADLKPMTLAAVKDAPPIEKEAYHPDREYLCPKCAVLSPGNSWVWDSLGRGHLQCPYCNRFVKPEDLETREGHRLGDEMHKTRAGVIPVERKCDCGADTPHWPGHPLHCRRPV